MTCNDCGKDIDDCDRNGCRPGERPMFPARSVARPSPDAQRAAYLKKECTCGAGFGDACCPNCWPV